MYEGMKTRINNFRNNRKARLSGVDTETTIKKSPDKSPTGKIEKRLSGSKRERLSDKADDIRTKTI
jgi:hypothetical protein